MWGLRVRDFEYWPWMADGRSLYSQVFWFWPRLTVKAVPESCSGKRPYFSFCGLFWSG